MLGTNSVQHNRPYISSPASPVTASPSCATAAPPLSLLHLLSLPVSRETIWFLTVNFHRIVFQMILLGHLRCAEPFHVRVHHLLHAVFRQFRCEAFQFRVRWSQRRIGIILLRFEDVDLLQTCLLSFFHRFYITRHMLHHHRSNAAKPFSGSSRWRPRLPNI